MTAAPAAHSGNGSSFTPLHEVPRFDLYCRADAIGNRSLVEVPGLLASAFRLPWPVAVTGREDDQRRQHRRLRRPPRRAGAPGRP